MSDVKTKLEGHRRAIRDHIDKYRRYELQREKDHALKTVQRIQGEIQDLKRRNPNASSSSEDTWRP
jgi:hypothetical protein